MRSLSLPLLALASRVAADVHEIWWNVSYAQANPDGLFERRVIGVNGTWPPPPIEVNKGDTIQLHVNNGLGDAPTSIHHHGMFFRNATFYDGAVGVTQCPIPAGSSFTYEVNTQEQSGTYWAHSHFIGQYVDGLRTPYIIHNTPEAYTYDEEWTIMVGDWYHDQHSTLTDQFMNIANPTGAEPIPDSAIMYFMQNGTYLPGFNENASLPFQPGKTYRLRVINSSALAMFWFWIDGHDISIIEVDGTDIEETPVLLQSIAVAQRYSFLVRARNDTSSNWQIHANMDPVMFDTVPDTLQLNITANIVYSSSAELQPGSQVASYTDSVDDHSLVPLSPTAIGLPDRSYWMNAFFATYDNGINRASWNNITYNAPLTPTFLTAMTMGTEANQSVAYGPSATVLDYEEVVELIVVNWDVGRHPFHLHGHKFALVWKSFDVTSDDPTINPPVNNNQPNPMWRDTVMVPPSGAVRIRFVANNPGTWFFHCHIDWHLTSGLAWAFIEAPDKLQAWVQAPSNLVSQCQAGNFPVSGNAAGHPEADNWQGLPLGPYPQVLGWTPKAIGAMFACVFSAVIGMSTVAWYAFTGMGDITRA